MTLDIDHLNDEQIMQHVKEGNLNYMELLFQRYQKNLYNYFLKCTLDSEESKDLTQKVFIRVLKYRNSFSESRNFNHWIFQIARNLVRDHFSGMKVSRDKYDLIENYPEIADQNLTEEQEEREKQLYRALSKLPDMKRELIVMAKLKGMKYEDVARIRNMTVGAVKVQVHRIISELRAIYFETTES